ncbi:MAG: T9SS type A sorting domain-containing protein [Bacteroidia bacterium]
MGFNSVKGRKVCGDGVSADYNIGLANTTSISTHASGGSADVSQNLIFSPTVTDLSVAPGATFGDSALLKVRLKGLLPSPYDYQLYGCSVPVNNCLMNGWLRAEVHCDTNLRIAGPATHAQLVYYRITQGDTLVLKPDYVFAAVDTNLCEAGNYNYYFNMNSAGFKAFLDSAHFEFTVQACCRIDKGATPYQINFYTLPNPSNCLTLTQTTPNTLPVISDVRQQWLPLSYTGDQISVHCPGCLAPGAIVSNYKINRVSFGLQDSNNDSRTDNATKIIKGDNYYNTFKNYLNENFAHYSDTLEDYLSAYFQDGDNSGTGGGYTYQQLVTAGVPLHFMQLSRIIPFGLDSFNLTIDSVVLYIDTLIPNTNACIDCADFGLTGNSVVTQSVVAFNRADAYSHCVLADVPRNQLLFTFCDTTGGNIQAFETFTNNSFPFVAFKTGQRYRLKVRYSVCGNYRLPFNSISNLVCNSPISNNLWFTGKQQGADAIATLPQMPNTVGAMETDFHYSFNASSGYPLPNQNFIDSARFYCETFGGRFYFAPTSYYNNSTVTNSQGCEKRITAVYIADLAGYRNRIFDVYPYEYKVPPLFADTISFQIPNGYYISLMRVRSGVYYDNNGQLMAPFSAYDTLTPPQLTGLVQIPFDALPVMHCLQQSMSPAGNDTAAFAGDQFTRLELQCFIRRFDCSNTIDTLPLSSVYSSTGLFESECNPTENLSCTPLATAADSIPFNANIQPLLVQPNLNLVLPVSNVANAQQQQLCWTVKVLNPKVVVQPGTPDIYSTGADNVFLGVPLNGAIPALQNWQFTPTGQSTINAVNGIIPLTAHLAAGDSVTGQLCATFVSCDSTINSFPLYYGWNCNGFPVATSQIPDTVCGAGSVTLGIEYFEAAITGEGKGYIPNNYTLCDTLKKFTCIFNSNPGYAYPDFAGLINIPQGLNILSAYILNPNATPVTVSYLTGSAPSWQITPANMQALGFANGGIHLTDRFCVYFNLIPECAFASDTILPNILVAGKNYCGDSLSYTAYFNYNNQNPLFMDSTACTDCWSITKTAGTDTAAAFTDTVTYTITVCNNSVNTQTGILSDITPPGFVTTGTTLPATVTLTSMQCSTFTVSGYFTQQGSCFYNVASVTSPANTVWKDSVCVTVTYPCTNSATLIIPDSTYSTALNYRYDTLDIYIAGRLYVNDTLKLMRCNVYMNAGAHIIVQAGGYLDIDSSVVMGCLTMWRGITVLDYGELLVHEGSTVTDADTTVLANNKAKATLQNAYIKNFVLGVYMPPSANAFYNGTTLKIEQTTFDFTAFKQNYAGQNTHGSKPECGVLLNDWIGTIGTYQDSLWLNKFLNLNNGIVVKSSTVTVKNCFFGNIQADAFYGKPYNGTSVVSVGDIAAGKRGNLTMQPVMNNHKTMTSCYGGVWTSYSTLNLNNVRMDSMYIGATVNRCKDYLSATIAWNEIKATRAGIVCNNNAGAAKLDLNNNTIHVDGTGLNVASGIVINEINKNGQGNYSIDNNSLYLYNVRYGIRMQNVYKPLLAHNYIEQNNSSSNFYSEGITSNNCDSTQIRCNGVRNLNVANTVTKGIVYSISSNASISCNSIDSTATGIFFGGNCMGAQLKGNTMRNNLLGLYINNVGLIGVQPNNGNKFIDYRDTVGAYNANTSQPGLFGSQFRVRTTDVPGNIYYPVLSQQNNGWFNPILNTSPFQCGATCYDMLEGIDNEILFRIIADDSVLTEEFIPESQSMARQYLFQILATNDSLLNSDTLFQYFYNEMLAEAEGQLNVVERRFETYGKMDSTFAPMLHNIDSLLKEFSNSVEDFEAMRDSIEQSGTNADSLFEQWTIQIENLETTRQNILLQHNAVISGEMYEGELTNNIINGDEQNETNSTQMNELFILLEEANYTNLNELYSQLLSIAEQCPYYGGEAVYRARAVLELVNDSLIYNDDVNCLLYGIYRKGQTSNEVSLEKIEVKPNPSSDHISIKVSCMENEIFSADITNAVGQSVLNKKLKCNQENIINIRELQQGAYMLVVRTKNKIQNFKLIIVR